jgi:NuA3 HAT complex component NTO1
LKDITDLVRKRETRKLRQAEVIYETMAQALFPHHGPLRHVFEKIMV